MAIYGIQLIGILSFEACFGFLRGYFAHLVGQLKRIEPRVLHNIMRFFKMISANVNLDYRQLDSLSSRLAS